MVHSFELPFDHLNAQSNRDVARPTSKRKRNSSRSSTQSENDGQSEDDLQHPRGNSTTVEGLERENEEEDVIPSDFPHAPLKESYEFSPLSKLEPQQHSLKRQHLAVLMTVVHKSLLDHDFDRAGRAFGTLLRVEHGGKHVDLRKKRLWAVAAEILLHNEGERGAARGERSENPLWMPSGFTDDGYRAARAFYDRLILQFPYKKSRPYDVNASTFYPAMFGLWISQIQDNIKSLFLDDPSYTISESRQSRERSSSEASGRSQSQNRSRSRSRSSLSRDEEYGHKLTDRKSRRHKEIKAGELVRAEEVAARLDELTLLPPYDQNTQLHQLKGMVALWIADLCLLLREGASTETEQREKAVSAFRRVRQYGGHLWEGYAHLLDDVA